MVMGPERNILDWDVPQQSNKRTISWIKTNWCIDQKYHKSGEISRRRGGGLNPLLQFLYCLDGHCFEMGLGQFLLCHSTILSKSQHNFCKGFVNKKLTRISQWVCMRTRFMRHQKKVWLLSNKEFKNYIKFTVSLGSWV